MCWMQRGAQVPGWQSLHSPEAARSSLSLGAVEQVSISLAAPKNWATDGDTVCPPPTPWPAHPWSTFTLLPKQCRKGLIPLQPPPVNIRTASSLTTAIHRPGLFTNKKQRLYTKCKVTLQGLQPANRPFKTASSAPWPTLGRAQAPSTAY